MKFKIGDFVKYKRTDLPISIGRVEKARDIKGECIYLVNTFSEEWGKCYEYEEDLELIEDIVTENTVEERSVKPKKKLYLAGDMLNKAAQMLRTIEREELEKIEGYEVFNPMDDKSINDKKNANQEGLAERIFDKDTKAILESEVIVADISQTLGTSIEMGQIAGYNYFIDRLNQILNESDDAHEVSTKVSALLREIPRKTVYWKTEDVRDTDIPEVGIRRSHSYNAYLIGCLLHIAGEPKTFEEILDILKK